jgi:uncharacterized protein YndB with AHSA1/START domain
MQERAVATVDRAPRRCYEAFTEAKHLTAWVPGLRRATVVETDASGRAREVKFDHGESLTYSLRYEYDDDARAVRWTPGVGVREAVSGEVRFDDDGAGCRITYELAAGVARREGAGAAAVLEAFVRWITALP